MTERKFSPERILVVAPSFPPAERPNALRAGAIATELERLGHDVRVIALAGDVIESGAPAMATAESSLTITQVRSAVSRKLANVSGSPEGARRGRVVSRFLQHLRSIVIPDPYILTLPALLRGTYRAFRQQKPTLLVTFSYPWTTILLGSIAAAVWRVEWVAVLADPWSGHPDVRRQHRFARLVIYRLERVCLERATRCVVTSRATADYYAQLLGGAARPPDVRWVRGGFARGAQDESVRAPAARPASTELRLVHAGRLYGATRTAQNLVDAVRRFNVEGSEGRARLTFIGGADDFVRAAVKDQTTQGMIDARGWIPRDRLESALLKFDYLVVLGWPRGLQIPAKLYHYLEIPRPIVYISRDCSDESAGLVRSLDAGDVVLDDSAEILSWLVRRLSGPRLEREAVSSRDNPSSRVATRFVHAVLGIEPTGDHSGVGHPRDVRREEGEK